MPPDREELVSDAEPVESSAAEPRLAPPSLKVTVPVGVPAPGATALTVAVNVTARLRFEGLPDELSDVVVGALLTVIPVTEEF